MAERTPAPQPEKIRLLFVPYIYGLVLLAAAFAQLITLHTFIPLLGEYLGLQSSALWPSFIAIVLIGMQIFSLPFLLGLCLSPLARVSSALLVLLTPLAWAGVGIAGNTFNKTYFVVLVCLFALAGASFWVLGGPKITRLDKHIL